jgi:hypothetical protein
MLISGLMEMEAQLDESEKKTSRLEMQQGQAVACKKLVEDLAGYRYTNPESKT